VKVEIARILKEEGYINDYEVTPDEQKKQGRIRIVMRYADGRERVIQHIERVSKPGRRIYVGKNDIQRVLGGLGSRSFPRRVVC
jgi:small subunit ribosomal protein S8